MRSLGPDAHPELIYGDLKRLKCDPRGAAIGSGWAKVGAWGLKYTSFYE